MNRLKPTWLCAFFLCAESISHSDRARQLLEASAPGHLALDQLDFVDPVLGLTGDARARRARCMLLQHFAQDCQRKSDNPQATPASVNGPALRASNGSQPATHNGRQTRAAASSATSGCFYSNDAPMAACFTGSSRHRNRYLPRIQRRFGTISLVA